MVNDRPVGESWAESRFLLGTEWLVCGSSWIWRLLRDMLLGRLGKIRTIVVASGFFSRGDCHTTFSSHEGRYWYWDAFHKQTKNSPRRESLVTSCYKCLIN